jgi:hypothetical protein
MMSRILMVWENHTGISEPIRIGDMFLKDRVSISLRRASLQPDTIKTLMMVKQRLRLARNAIKEVLGNE